MRPVLNDHFRAHKRVNGCGVVLCLMGFLLSPAVAQSDVLTLNGGSLAAGETGVFPIFLQDVSGSGIDTGTENVGAIRIRMTVPANLVNDGLIRPAGLLASFPNIVVVSSPGDVFNPATNEFDWFIVFSSAPPFNLDASSPGDLIAELELTASGSASGQTISFSPHGEDTLVQSELGETVNTIASGKLIGNLQSISVTQTSGGNPVVNSFAASPPSIVTGGSSTLSWDVSDADSVVIDQGIGTVSSSGTFVVSPNVTTLYTLTATNGNGQTQRSTTVVVSSDIVPPTINFFRVSPTSISPGQTAELEWSVSNSNEVAIDQSIGVVSAAGTHDVQPVVTTTYKLTATNAFGSSTANATVTVVTGVRIDSFTGTPNAIRIGEKVTLAWETTNAVTVTLNPGNMTVDPSGSLDVFPATSAEYILRATGSQGQNTSAVVQITVFNTDIELTVSTSSIELGEDLVSSSFDLTAVNIASVDWHVVKKPAWATLNPPDGQVGSIPTRISVSADRSDMYPAEFKEGTIEIAATGVPSVTLEVSVAKREQPLNGAMLLFPNAVVDDDHESVIRVVNGENATGKLDIQIFNQLGELENVIRNLHFPPFGSYQRTLPEMATTRGWVVVTVNYSDQASGPRIVHGCLVTRTLDGQEIVATTPSRKSSGKLFVPHIAKDPSFYTEASAVNLSPDTMLDFSSQQVGTLMVDAVDSGEQSSFDFRELMGGDILGPGWGELELDSDTPRLGGMEVFGRSKSTGLRQSVGVGIDGETANQIIFSHIAADIVTFWTGVVLINTSGQESEVTIESFDSTGAGTVIVENFGPFEKRSYLVTGDQLAFGTDSSWVRATSNAPLVGYELFGTYDDRFAGFEGVRELSEDLFFPHLEQTVTTGGWTGLAAVNPGSIQANLTIEVYSRLGVLKDTLSSQLGAKQKLVALVSTLFPNTSFERGDWVLMHSDQPIAGFELFGFGQSTLAAILAATPLP